MRKREGTKFWDKYEKEPEKQKILEDWKKETQYYLFGSSQTQCLRCGKGNKKAGENQK
jgi:hypothetical protein